MDQFNDSLGRRLRDAAVDRTHARSERVDDFVLDADGVIDLRDFETGTGEKSIAAPAAALAAIKGRLGDAAEVSDLYDESEPPEPIWRRALRPRRPADRATPATPEPSTAPDITFPVPPPRLPPISRLSMVPLSTDLPRAAPRAEDESPAAPRAQDEPAAAPRVDDASPDRVAEPAPTASRPSDGERPSAPCPRCDGIGQRDLFDRFSQVEFYSCDLCNHMWQQDRR